MVAEDLRETTFDLQQGRRIHMSQRLHVWKICLTYLYYTITSETTSITMPVHRSCLGVGVETSCLPGPFGDSMEDGSLRAIPSVHWFNYRVLRT